jgi:hypothetical protein
VGHPQFVKDKDGPPAYSSSFDAGLTLKERSAVGTLADKLDVKRYTRLRRVFFYLAAAFIPLFVLLAVVSSALFQTYKPADVVAIAWLAVLSILWIRLSYWRCPRCRGFIGWWPPLVARCGRCGFPKASSAGGPGKHGTP